MAISTLFSNNRTQAVRLPAELRMPENVKRVDVRVRGIERIISPAGRTWDSFFLDSESASDDFMDARADQVQANRESF
jgi:antitoxin VapB